jgi:hypothetical protein
LSGFKTDFSGPKVVEKPHGNENPDKTSTQRFPKFEAVKKLSRE